VTYSHFHFRPGELSEVDLDRVEKVLKKSLIQARDLYEDQPTVPAYTRSLIQVYFQLATTQQSFPRFFGPQNRDLVRQKLSEAERNYRAAEELQRWLVRRFPESLSYHLWLARYRRSIGVVLQLQFRWEEAGEELLAAIQEAKQIPSELQDSDRWHLTLSSLHRELSLVYRQLDERDLEFEHLFESREHLSEVRNASLRNRLPFEENPPNQSGNGPPPRRPPPD
jgi:hypothetical protein